MAALVFPLAIYGSESWTLRKKERAKLNAFELWCWRRMLRIPWTAKRTNASICKQVEAHTSLDNIVKRRKLMYLGHKQWAEEGHHVRHRRRAVGRGTPQNKMDRMMTYGSGQDYHSTC